MEAMVLEAMSQLALDYLREQLPDDTGDKSRPWEWYVQVRRDRPDLLFPYLVETARDSLSPNYYVLRPDPHDAETAILEQRERTGDDELRLPFVPSTGAQSGALGPVIKRTYSKAKGPGPSQKINATTRKEFREIAGSGEPWSRYFDYVSSVISRPKLRFRGEVYEGDDGIRALELAVQEISEGQTCYLTVARERRLGTYLGVPPHPGRSTTRR
jgi:hypothetical protein